VKNSIFQDRGFRACDLWEGRLPRAYYTDRSPFLESNICNDNVKTRPGEATSPDGTSQYETGIGIAGRAESSVMLVLGCWREYVRQGSCRSRTDRKSSLSEVLSRRRGQRQRGITTMGRQQMEEQEEAVGWQMIPSHM